MVRILLVNSLRRLLNKTFSFQIISQPLLHIFISSLLALVHKAVEKLQFDIQQRTYYVYSTFTYREVEAIPQSKECPRHELN